MKKLLLLISMFVLFCSLAQAKDEVGTKMQVHSKNVGPVPISKLENAKFISQKC